jgi:hypothetical protein
VGVRVGSSSLNLPYALLTALAWGLVAFVVARIVKRHATMDVFWGAEFLAVYLGESLRLAPAEQVVDESVVARRHRHRFPRARRRRPVESAALDAPGGAPTRLRMTRAT